MAPTWRESDVPVLNPEVDFRINVESRTIAGAGQTDPDEIWWQLVVQLADGFSLNDLITRAIALGLGDDSTAYLAIRPEYPAEFRSNPAEAPVTVYARSRYIDAANKNWEAAGIDWLKVGPAYRPSEVVIQEDPFAVAQAKKVSVPEGSAVIAVIDHGMAVGHNLFWHTDAAGDPVSRIAFFWNMDAALQNLMLPGIEQTSVGLGMTDEFLSEMLKQNIHNGLLDDQAFYKAIGSTDWGLRRHTPVAHRLSHGTHVMGLCAGYPTDKATDPAEAEKRPIIAVNLPTTDVHDPSGKLFHDSLEMALTYILKRYKRFRITGQPNKRPPLVINFSFGNYAGPHDGTSIFETTIKDALLQAKTVNSDSQFILPAGNSNLSRTHARIDLSDAAPSRTLEWRVQPADGSTSTVEIWLDKIGSVANDFVTLTVAGPGGTPPVTLKTKKHAHRKLFDPAGDQIGGASFKTAGSGPFKRGHFRIHLLATASPLEDGRIAPAGLWKLTLTSAANAGAVGMNAWVVRDETLPGFPVFGRQSYFDDPDYARFYEPGVDAYHLDHRLIGAPLGYDPVNTSAMVRRAGTINGFAASDDAIVVGGCVGAIPKNNANMALTSSTGLTVDGTEVFPDASARSDASPVLGGVLSAGSASGSLVAMQGTSVAAPQVARWVAGQAGAGNPAGPANVRTAANAKDPTDAGNPRKPPKIRSGGGRMVDLKNLFGRSRWPGQPE